MIVDWVTNNGSLFLSERFGKPDLGFSVVLRAEELSEKESRWGGPYRGLCNRVYVGDSE